MVGCARSGHQLAQAVQTLPQIGDLAQERRVERSSFLALVGREEVFKSPEYRTRSSSDHEKCRDFSLSRYMPGIPPFFAIYPEPVSTSISTTGSDADRGRLWFRRL
jgi:hypothetical protein